MVEVEHWAVFRHGQAGGNPCPVVTEARHLAPGQMQAIAGHYGHESAFVTKLEPTRVSLRFFVPRHEMRICVHGTIAANTALAGCGAIAGEGAVISTASGEHRVRWTGARPLEVTVEQAAPQFGLPAAVHAEMSAALGLPGASPEEAAPIRPVGVSRAKLIVPVRDADAVHQASPDFPALWGLCRRLETIGAYVFAPHPDGDPHHVVARQFPFDVGYPEDPATGCGRRGPGRLPGYRTRAGAADLDRHHHQGDTMGQPSFVRAAALTAPAGITRTSVTGRAVRTGQARLSLSAITAVRELPEPELR